MDRVKEHWNKHKTVYLCGVTGIVAAGITALIMRSNTARGAVGESGARGALTNTAIMRESHAGLIDRIQRGLQDHRVHGFSLFLKSPISNSFNQTVVSVVERESRGHPGYIVTCKETLENFLSQDKAALSEGVSAKIMSLHLHGKLDDINGHHFERVAA